MVDPSYLDVHKGFIDTSLDLLLDILFIVLGRLKNVNFYLFFVADLLSLTLAYSTKMYRYVVPWAWTLVSVELCRTGGYLKAVSLTLLPWHTPQRCLWCPEHGLCLCGTSGIEGYLKAVILTLLPWHTPTKMSVVP